jgi:hypothetical protein
MLDRLISQKKPMSFLEYPLLDEGWGRSAGPRASSSAGPPPASRRPRCPRSPPTGAQLGSPQHRPDSSRDALNTCFQPGTLNSLSPHAQESQANLAGRSATNLGG